LLTRCCVLALAKDRSIAAGERRKMRRSIVRSMRQIEREDMPWASPLAAALSASTAAASGDVLAAREFLRRAATGFEAASMSLWAAAARHQAGLREGTQWMSARGVADPERYAEMMIPIRTISPE